MSKNLVRFIMLSALIPAACSGQVAPTPASASAPARTSTSSAASSAAASPTTPPGADGAGIVWLCMPGESNNSCEGDLSTTVIDPSGNRTVSNPAPAADPPIDCFYVYPTTSRQQTMNADLSIDPEERAVAAAQAALFSQVCEVYAPIYPQLTLVGISGGATLEQVQLAYDGVKAAFDDYMANYNHGRGVVFIGHSQGSMLLISLLAEEVDVKPEVRKLLVSALLMGANATTAPGKTSGGDFANIPTCTSTKEIGCVVGYSSFDQTPPVDAVFGTTSSLGMLRPPEPGEQVMCVNPAAPGGEGTLQPIFPTADLANLSDGPQPLPATPYVAYPDEFSAECQINGTATWLQVTRIGPPGAAPVLAGSEGPSWGLHDFDVSLGLGNLVELVRSEAAAYKP